MLILVLLCLVLAILLGGGYYAYRYAFFSPKEGREDLPVHKGKQYVLRSFVLPRIGSPENAP